MEELSSFLMPGEYHNMVWFYQAAEDEVPEVAVIEEDRTTQRGAEEDKDSNKVRLQEHCT